MNLPALKTAFSLVITLTFVLFAFVVEHETKSQLFASLGILSAGLAIKFLAGSKTGNENN